MLQKAGIPSEQHCSVVQRMILDTWTPSLNANVMDIMMKMLGWGGFISVYKAYCKLSFFF